jgi:hypothetical protein
MDISLPAKCVPAPSPDWEKGGWIDRHNFGNFYIFASTPDNYSFITAYLLFSGSNYKHFSRDDKGFIYREKLDADTPHADYCKRMGYRE